MRTGYIYVSSNGAKDDNNAYILSEIQSLFNLAYRAGIVIRQVFVDFCESGAADSKPQLDQLMQAMHLHPGRVVLVTDVTRISRNMKLLNLFFLTVTHTNSQLACLSQQGKGRGEDDK